MNGAALKQSPGRTHNHSWTLTCCVTRTEDRRGRWRFGHVCDVGFSLLDDEILLRQTYTTTTTTTTASARGGLGPSGYSAALLLAQVWRSSVRLLNREFSVQTFQNRTNFKSVAPSRPPSVGHGPACCRRAVRSVFFPPLRCRPTLFSLSLSLSPSRLLTAVHGGRLLVSSDGKATVYLQRVQAGVLCRACSSDSESNSEAEVA